MEGLGAGSILTEAGRLVGLQGRGGWGNTNLTVIPAAMLRHKGEVRTTTKSRQQHQVAELCVGDSGDQKKSTAQSSLSKA